MKNVYKIAGFGLAAGAAVMIAFAAPATARGPAGGFGADGAMGAGPRGGVFALQFADLDSDGDGQIAEAELTARAQALAADRLAEVDADGDGSVTAAELETQILARIAERGQVRPGKGLRAGDPAEMAKAMVERILSARDTDEDGVLSGAELSPAADMAALIDRFDTDDDNAWSEAEFSRVTMARGDFGDRGRGAKGDRGGKRR